MKILRKSPDATLVWILSTGSFLEHINASFSKPGPGPACARHASPLQCPSRTSPHDSAPPNDKGLQAALNKYIYIYLGYLGNKKLLGAKGIATRSKDATSRSWPYYQEQEATS